MFQSILPIQCSAISALKKQPSSKSSFYSLNYSQASAVQIQSSHSECWLSECVRLKKFLNWSNFRQFCPRKSPIVGALFGFSDEFFSCWCCCRCWNSWRRKFEFMNKWTFLLSQFPFWFKFIWGFRTSLNDFFLFLFIISCCPGVAFAVDLLKMIFTSMWASVYSHLSVEIILEFTQLPNGP